MSEKSHAQEVVDFTSRVAQILHELEHDPKARVLFELEEEPGTNPDAPIKRMSFVVLLCSDISKPFGFLSVDNPKQDEWMHIAYLVEYWEVLHRHNLFDVSRAWQRQLDSRRGLDIRESTHRKVQI